MSETSSSKAATRGILLRKLYKSQATKLSSMPMIKGKNFVPGRGSVFPKFIFVGEAPGRNEDAIREPFVGRSGQVLSEMLQENNIAGVKHYTTNCVKWWPTEVIDGRSSTRAPTPAEKRACRFFLFKEIGILGYPPLVFLGRHSSSVFRDGMPRAEWVEYSPNPNVGYEQNCPSFRMVRLYHPAAGLYQGSLMPTIREEFARVMEGFRATV